MGKPYKQACKYGHCATCAGFPITGNGSAMTNPTPRQQSVSSGDVMPPRASSAYSIYEETRGKA